MNKQELVAAVAAKLEVSVREATRVVEATFGAVEEAVLKGETVKVPGFGIFTVKERAARTGVVPNTNKKIEIPARKVVTFKAAKGLKEQL